MTRTRPDDPARHAPSSRPRGPPASRPGLRVADADADAGDRLAVVGRGDPASSVRCEATSAVRRRPRSSPSSGCIGSRPDHEGRASECPPASRRAGRRRPRSTRAINASSSSVVAVAGSKSMSGPYISIAASIADQASPEATVATPTRTFSVADAEGLDDGRLPVDLGGHVDDRELQQHLDPSRQLLGGLPVAFEPAPRPGRPTGGPGSAAASSASCRRIELEVPVVGPGPLGPAVLLGPRVPATRRLPCPFLAPSLPPRLPVGLDGRPARPHVAERRNAAKAGPLSPGCCSHGWLVLASIVLLPGQLPGFYYSRPHNRPTS